MWSEDAPHHVWFNRYPSQPNGLETEHDDSFWRVFGEALEDLETCGQSELLREIEVTNGHLKGRERLVACVQLRAGPTIGLMKFIGPPPTVNKPQTQCLKAFAKDMSEWVILTQLLIFFYN